MRRRLRIVLGIVAFLILLPFAIYSSFPIWGAIILKEQLTEHAFTNIIIELGYPDQRSLEIHKLGFTKVIPGESIAASFQNVTLTYQISELLKGTVDHIIIRNVELESTPHPRGGTPSAASSTSTLTANDLFFSIPILPFQELQLEQASMNRPQNPEPFRQLQISGAVRSNVETLKGKFSMEGPQFPLYELEISGTPTGEIDLLLQSLRPSPTPVFSIKTSLKKIEKNAGIQGEVTTNLSQLSSFASLLLPIDKELQPMTGNLTAEWHAAIPQTAALDNDMKKKVETIDGSVDIQIALPQWKSLGTDFSATVKGNFAFTNGLLTWTLAEQSQVAANVNLSTVELPEKVRSYLPPTYHRVLIDLPEKVTGQVNTTTQLPELTLTGQIRTKLAIKELPLNIELSLMELAGTLPSDFTGQGNFQLSGTLPNVTHNTASIKQSAFKFSGQTALNKENFLLTIDSGSTLDAISFRNEELSIPRMKLAIQEPVSATYQLHNQGWKVQPTLIQLQMPNLTWKDTDLSFDGGKLTLEVAEGDSTNWKTNGELMVLHVGTTMKMNDYSIPKTNWKVRFSGSASIIGLQFLCQTSDKLISIFGQSFVDLSNQTGWGQFKTAPLMFGPSSFLLHEYFQPWPFPIDIIDGEASASARISWEPDPETDGKGLAITNAETTIDLQHLTGHYEQIILNDLTTTITLSGLDPWSMPNSAKLTIKEIQSGLSATDIAMNFQVRQNPASSFPLLDIPNISLHTLGGQITSRDIQFDELNPENSFILQAENLVLEKIFELEQQEGLHGTGILDGTLPMTLSSTGIEIHGGRIEARPPGGVIQFQPAEGTAQTLSQANANMNLVLQALSNFHYDVLHFDVDYQKDGTLILQTKLEGRNPDFKKGVPFNFNLNIQENIPALLKSLQVTSGIEEQIERMIQ